MPGYSATLGSVRVSAACAALLSTSLLVSGSAAEVGADQGAVQGPTYDNESTVRMKVGVEVSAGDGAFHKMVATFPLPMDWPEQTVTIVEKDFSSHVGKARIKVLDGGARQVEVRIPRLAAGQTARAVYVIDVARRWTNAPADTQALEVPRHVPRELRKYLQASPLIETGHREIKEAAEKFAIDRDKPAWSQVEAIYKWVRQHIKHDEGTIPLRGALAALQQQKGDCEEYTSLFVALCRVNGIPARSVWVPGHTYPEFYLENRHLEKNSLENQKSQGHWFPCESLGTYSFGRLHRHDVVLQKGDNFKMSQKKERQRYVAETLSGLPAGRGGGHPTIQPVREFGSVEAQ
jgi:hypothetical protein